MVKKNSTHSIPSKKILTSKVVVSHFMTDLEKKSMKVDIGEKNLFITLMRVALVENISCKKL